MKRHSGVHPVTETKGFFSIPFRPAHSSDNEVIWGEKCHNWAFISFGLLRDLPSFMFYPSVSSLRKQWGTSAESGLYPKSGVCYKTSDVFPQHPELRTLLGPAVHSVKKQSFIKAPGYWTGWTLIPQKELLNTVSSYLSIGFCLEMRSQFFYISSKNWPRATSIVNHPYHFDQDGLKYAKSLCSATLSVSLCSGHPPFQAFQEHIKSL